MPPFQALLQRTILALVLLQIASCNPMVHAQHGLHHVARHPQPWRWFPFNFASQGRFHDNPVSTQPSQPPAAQPAPAPAPPAAQPVPAPAPPTAQPVPAPAPPAAQSVPAPAPPAVQPAAAPAPPAAQPAPSPFAQQAPSPAPDTNPSSPPNSSSQASSLNTSASSLSTSASSLNTSTPVKSSTTVPRSNSSTGGCSTVRVRREWRKFSHQEQADYINAVKCLADLPSKLLPGGDYRRYDDFENVHSRMRNKIHWIAAFLPWHRQFMFYYEQALRNECAYSGSLPRWDWTLDSADMSKSPIWSSDPDVGFGGDGRDFSNADDGLDGGVITDGAFANWPLYYPEYHELQRSYNLPTQYRQRGRSYGSQFFDNASINRIQSQTTYQKFALALEGTDPSSTGPSNPGPHSIIHVIIGGDISPTAYAANEPLFYLHHCNVDSHWWRWQNAQRSTRLNAYGGPATRGSTRNDAKPTDVLKFLGLGPDVRVQDTMDTTAAPYCYRYE
ncbi:hypothetical protein PGT21_008706 [Puccinia graminis f. sp. tritici]|uniref:Tyrosinase copper-binding domain-containing protein n=1 Tax=Puccinia graminis f. sp. tritici TaxID=56615 RepID=A0A5B0M9P8_PUCGR|nr:hypothetical protein PGT21_008706 [Puccinia graminis f. sp. tritici]